MFATTAFHRLLDRLVFALNLAISGNVTGSMLVSFGASRQSVSISTQGIALKDVSIDLTRN